jgi:hypothetical protein
VAFSMNFKIIFAGHETVYHLSARSFVLCAGQRTIREETGI